MTTATQGGGLTLYKPEGFLALGGGDAAMREAMDSVAEVETFGPGDLTRVKVPSGGATRWTIEGPVTETVDAIEGVLCHVQNYGVLWASEEPTEGELPVLRTFDFKTAEQVGPIPPEMAEVLEPYRVTDPQAEGPQVFKWAELPYAQFGSGKGGNGKRVKEMRLLSILRPGDIYPVVVNCSPGSLKNWRQFFLKLPQAVKAPYWYAVVSLGLEKAKNAGGQPFAKIVPKLVGRLEPAAAAKVKAAFTDTLARVARAVADDSARDAEDGDGPF